MKTLLILLLAAALAAGFHAFQNQHPHQQLLAWRVEALATDSLIDRRQGKGTYVAEHTQERALFRFFRMARPGGARVIPTAGGDVLKRRVARAQEISKLLLKAG